MLKPRKTLIYVLCLAWLICVAGIDVTLAWSPPIGIPAPSFGIDETYRMYDDPNNWNSPTLTYTPSAEGGYYTHYVDNTAGNPSDGSDGTEAVPRNTIPRGLPAGSVVEVHNSASSNGFGECLIEGVGTVTMPIFVRGVNVPRVNLLMDVGYYGNTRYLIVDGISFFRGAVYGRQDGNVFETSDISIRNCDFYGDSGGGGTIINSFTSNSINNIVFYGNTIHDNGVWDPEIAEGDQDNHGVGIGNASYIWIVDNEMYHNSGDGVQINSGNIENQNTHHIYVGRNTSHHNKQAGFWTKQAQDVIFSENITYGHRPSSSSGGAGMGFQYDQQRVWFIFNKSYDNTIGIACGSPLFDPTTREDIYILGNIIHDNVIGLDMNSRGVDSVMIVNNTIYNVTDGIKNSYYTASLQMSNNIIAGVSGNSIDFGEYGSGAVSDISYTLFDSPVRINWDDTVYNSIAAFQSGEGKGAGCIEADPLFVNADANDFHIQNASPASGTGTLSSVYATFQGLYGIDIKKDIEGTSRPLPGVNDWDIGAYETNAVPPNQVTITISSSAGGSVTNPGEGALAYVSGSQVSIVAAPISNYYFVNWTGTAVDASKVADTNAASTTVTVDANYDLTANFSNQYTLDISATGGGSVSDPGEGSFQYSYGSPVPILAVTPVGYHFNSWTGTAVDAANVLNPNAVNTTVTVEGNYTLVAGFGINTYNLTYNAGANGSITGTTPQTVNYGSDGAAVTAVPDTGYQFVDWSDASTDNPRTDTNITANVNVTANFAINTYTLTYNAGANGSVSGTTPQTVDHGSDGTAVTAVPDTGYLFVDWDDDGSTDNPRTDTNITADVTVTANFAADTIAPVVTNRSPDVDSIQKAINSLVLLDITDSGVGVDNDTVEITVNGDLIYDGDSETSVGVYDSTGSGQTVKGVCRRTGSSSAYKYIFQADAEFEFDQQLSVTVNAADLAATPNVMNPNTYSFMTEMRAFGENRILHLGASNDNWGPLSTVSDGNGNLWVAWPEGAVDSRDIYVGKVMPGAESFINGNVVQVTNDVPDQGHPVIAVDSADKLYMAWEDKRHGEWDIYMSTSTDGISWSTEIRITDPNSDQINPAIAIDSADKVYVVWEDDQNTDKEIYIASSTDNYVNKTRITTAVYDQITPDIAIAHGDDTVYVVWADARNGGGDPKYDLYGASDVSWNNILMVTASDQQSIPKIATEDDGNVLHFVWLDDRNGDDDIYYATSNGMPGAPLAGSNVIDEVSTDQFSPVIATTGSTSGNDLKVFTCWRDERNASAELYASEITASGTNIYVGNDFTTDDQSEPAIGIDENNQPYLVWINGRTDICYAGNTYIEPVPIVNSAPVVISSSTIIGTPFGSINDTDDVSVEIPAGAYFCDMNITISKIRNPQKYPTSTRRTFLYEFGPSGTTFSQPVTITLPFTASSTVTTPSVYWYNHDIGAYSQSGISDVQVIGISSGLYALRFKTTHFSGFGGGGGFGGFGGGGGGGGCSMSSGSDGTMIEFLLPYLGLLVVMTILKLRDQKKRS